jgi:histidinol-phosphatase
VSGVTDENFDQPQAPAWAAPGSLYREDLALAQQLADIAARIALERFGALDLRVETKPDHTPVTDADKAVERAVRARIAEARPGDEVLGEEYGGRRPEDGDGRRVWIIDPIDGTKSYLRGVPVWGNLIGLAVSGRAVVGVVGAPALGRRWWAAEGGGAWRRLDPTLAAPHPTAPGSVPGAPASAAQTAPPTRPGPAPASATPTRFTDGDGRAIEPIHVSGVTELRHASVSYSSLSGWEHQGRLQGFLDLTRSVWRTRAYGDFWSYMLVAEGVVDAAAEPTLALHDMAALAPIVTEAGGRFTDTRGQVEGPFGSDALATNGPLHDQVAAFLG